MAEEEAKVPGWLVTFSDLMTLLLTFFVLLLSMSVVDKKKRMLALGSIQAAFGVVEGKKVPEDSKASTTLEHGVFDEDDAKDLLSEQVKEASNPAKDIQFIMDRDVPIISLSSSVLFARGEHTLTANGRKEIDKLLPLLLEIKKPLKILGSTSSLYDEFNTIDVQKGLTKTWKLSLYRALSIYTYMKERNMPLNKILLEGVGEFNAFTKKRDSAVNLRKSRRIDIVLDKSDADILQRLEKVFTKDSKGSMEYKGFTFSVTP